MKRNILLLLSLVLLMALPWSFYVSSANEIKEHGITEFNLGSGLESDIVCIDKERKSCCGKHKKKTCKTQHLCITIPARGAIPSAKMYVKIQGPCRADVPTIVFIHGTLESSDSWCCQQQAFCKCFRTIAFDLRGAGRSTLTSPDVVDYSSDLFADDIQAALQILGVNKFIYVGHSIGANLGLVYVNKFPGQVTKLVLVSGDPYLVVPDCAISLNCAPSNCSSCWQFPLATESQIAEYQAQIAQGGFYNFAVDVSKTKFFPENCQSQLVCAQALNVEQFIRAGFPIFNSIMLNIWSEDLRPLLPGINIPTLFCYGGADVLVPPGASFYMHNAVPGSILVEFIGKGHNLMISDYRNFNEVLVKFIKGCTLPSAFSVGDFSCCVCPCANTANFNKYSCP